MLNEGDKKGVVAVVESGHKENCGNSPEKKKTSTHCTNPLSLLPAYDHKYKHIIINVDLDLSGMDDKIAHFIHSICTFLINVQMVDNQVTINLVSAFSTLTSWKNAGDDVSSNMIEISSHTSILGNNFQVFKNSKGVWARSWGSLVNG